MTLVMEQYAEYAAVPSNRGFPLTPRSLPRLFACTDSYNGKSHSDMKHTRDYTTGKLRVDDRTLEALSKDKVGSTSYNLAVTSRLEYLFHMVVALPSAIQSK